MEQWRPPIGWRGEIRSLTGLRLVAAVWVLGFHFHFTPGAELGQLFAAARPLLGNGALGVDLFFVISGFVIAHTYLAALGPALHAKPVARFLWARICRVWPVYALVTTLFGVVLLAKLRYGADGQVAFQAVQPEVSVESWFHQLLMIQMWTQPFHDGASWVGPAWSISAEWLVYLLFPITALLFFRAARLPRIVLGALSVAVMVPTAAVLMIIGNPYYPFSWAVRLLAGFSAGVLLYLRVRSVRRSPIVQRWAGWIAGGTVAAITLGLWLGSTEVSNHRGGVVIVLFPVLIGAVALADGGRSRLLGSRWAVHGGRMSYSLYLVHIPIFELAWSAMLFFPALAPDSPAGLVLAGLALVGVLGAAHLLYRFVEEPARRRLRDLAGHRRVAPSRERRSAVARGGSDRRELAGLAAR